MQGHPVRSGISAALAPIGALWRLAESRLWISIGLLGLVALATWQIGKPMWTLAPVFLISLLLMRADFVRAAPPAE